MRRCGHIGSRWWAQGEAGSGWRPEKADADGRRGEELHGRRRRREPRNRADAGTCRARVGTLREELRVVVGSGGEG